MNEQHDNTVEALKKRVRFLERRVAQAERQAETSETISAQSKRAMLRTHTELRAMIDELQDAKQAAESASQAKDRFLATISHEMRTPLNGILGSIELLRCGQLDEESAELAGLMHRSTTSLLQIINDVLDLSKVEANRIDLECVPFKLEDCVRSVVDLQLQAARLKGIEIECDYDSNLPESVVGDPVRLRQVLLNLTDNAIKFTKDGTITIVAHRSEHPGHVSFSISDEGVGIHPLAITKIFDAFTQEDSSTTRRFGGTGLGLAICGGLVDLMDGELQVISTRGMGSTFIFSASLPEAVDDNDQDRIAFKDTLPSFDLRVLVVDDNRVNRVIATKMLARLGCSSVEAVDGREAVDLCLRDDFDLVLMDCSMPVLDGFEATRLIRGANDDRSRTPILAMTAYAMKQDRQRCIEAGMDGYLAKPVELSKLSQAIRTLGLALVDD